MDKRSLKTMSDEECKNLVYLMLRRYGDRWQTDFAEDMNIDPKDCMALYDGYKDIVLNEIEAEKEKEKHEETPTVEEIIRRGMKRLADIIDSDSDPSKVARAIDIISSLPDDNTFKREKKKSIFEIMQDKAKSQ